MPLPTKICGLSTPDTLDAAIKGGASHVGLVFHPKSPRHVSLDRAASLAARVPAHVRIVAVLVEPTADLLDSILASVRIDSLQLHGHESPADIVRIRAATGLELWKALSIRTRADLREADRYAGAADRILFDAKTGDPDMPGGMGVRFDWSLLQGFRHTIPWALSGGLDADNVADAVRITGAPLVDVSSGVESAPGVKAVDKIAAFLKAAATL